MKNILIFSNPFGYGPSGKALSIARYLHRYTSNVRISLCGGKHFESMAALEGIAFIRLDERDEASIGSVLREAGKNVYVISSQNRFAVKAAKKMGIPCAFLDGLAWFWKTIPSDHCLADIIFWLNYPNINNKITPQIQDRVRIIHGITDGQSGVRKRLRSGILMYIGGCMNPLTSLPTDYLKLVSTVVCRTRKAGYHIELVTDSNSKEWLEQSMDYACDAKTYSHEAFVSRLSKAKRFITNGGQTATMEAASTGTSVSFFLPINLSQAALIMELNIHGSVYPYLWWPKFIKAFDPKIMDLGEKEAIGIFNAYSKSLLADEISLGRLVEDFLQMLIVSEEVERRGVLDNIGSTGTEDILNILKREWAIS